MNDQKCSSVQATIQQISSNLKLIQKVQKGILLIGNSGSGKSTLANYLFQNPNLKAVKKMGKKKFLIAVDKDNAFSKIIIGGQVQSATSVPVTVQYEGLTIRDLPGFNDNRLGNDQLGHQDLKNSFYLRQIFKKTSSFKIVLVEKYCSIVDRADLFLGLLATLTRLFEDIQLLKDHCLLVLTQHLVYQDQLKQTQNQLIEISQFAKKNEKLVEFQLLNYIIVKKRFLFFHQPAKINIVDFKESESIKKALQSSEWCKKDKVKTNLVVSLNTKQYLSKNAQIIQTKVIERIKRLFQIINDELKALYDKNSFKKMQIEMKMFRSQISELKIEDFHACTKKIFSNYSQIIKVLKDLQKILNFLDVVEEIADKKFYDINQIRSQIKNSIQVKLSKQNKIVMINNQQLAYLTNKPIAKSIEIQQIVDRNKSNFKNFIFFSERIFLDQNIVANGINLFFFSKILQTKQKKQITIDLKGLDGKNKYFENAIDTHGEAGQNGSNGGSLFFQFQELIGSGIIANLKGGNGGNGQSCEISDLSKYIPNWNSEKLFKQDSKKQDIQKQFLYARQNHGWDEKKGFKALTHAAKKFLTFNGQVLQTYRTDTKKAWEKYYKLLPGAGGKSGNPGKFNFNYPMMLNNKKDDNDNKIRDKFNVLIEGSNQGSSGSLIIDHWEGKFIRQLVFSCARQEGNSINEETGTDIVAKNIFLTTSGLAGKILFQELAKQAAETAIGSVTTTVTKVVVQLAAEAAVQQFGKLAIQKVAEQTASTAIENLTKQLAKISMQYATKVVGKQFGKVAAQKVTEQVAKQAIKQTTLQAAQTVGGAGLFGFGMSLGIGLAVQAVISPISAALSDEWVKQMEFLQKVSFKPPYCIQTNQENKAAFCLSQQEIADLKKRFECQI